MSARHCSSDKDYHCEDMTKTRKYPDYCRTITFTDNNGVVRELVFPKALDLDRPKRARTTFSREQLDRLEAEFTANQYLVGRERTQLATTLGLSETQVKVWFQNRRTKHKREREKQEESQGAKNESLAVRSLLTSLPPSRVTFTAGSAAMETSSSLTTPFLTPLPRDLPPPSLPPPPASDRDAVVAAAFSAAPSPRCAEDSSTMLIHSSGVQSASHGSLPRFPPTTSPPYAKDRTSLTEGALAYPLSRFGAARHLTRAGSLPVSSVSTVPPVPSSSSLGRASSCAPFSGLLPGGSAARYGSLRSDVGIREAWSSHSGYVAACHTPVGPVLARALPLPAAWPIYSHSLTP